MKKSMGLLICFNETEEGTGHFEPISVELVTKAYVDGEQYKSVEECTACTNGEPPFEQPIEQPTEEIVLSTIDPTAELRAQIEDLAAERGFNYEVFARNTHTKDGIPYRDFNEAQLRACLQQLRELKKV